MKYRKMRLISGIEIQEVSGGDAGATRQEGQNSWGEYPSDYPKGLGELELWIRNCGGKQDCMEYSYHAWYMHQ